MKGLVLSLLALLFIVSVSGCPRDKGGDKAEGDAPTSQLTPPAEDAKTAEPDTAAKAGDAAANPCAGNPCAAPADAEAANPCNPCAKPAEASSTEKPAAGVTNVVLETTKGKVVIEVHPEWAPLGAAHFLELVNLKYYDGAPWFRVIEGFVAQCGFSGTEALTQQWMQKTINDEPVVQGNTAGTVCFGKSGMPNSRSTHIFINLVDNTQGLDPQGFACFGRVIEGMDVAMQFFVCEGDQGALAAPGGIATFKKQFPEADFITKAYVQK